MNKPFLPMMPEGGPLWFPPVEQSFSGGLLMAGGDLSPARLLHAYSQGIFPWYEAGSPILWWSPDPRCVLFPEKIHRSGSLRRLQNSGKFSFSVDSCFSRVIRSCAEISRPGQQGTWIVPEMVEAYEKLHEMGHAHSVEVWQNGSLAGGLYGVCLGRVFFGESMFHCESGASKMAVVYLTDWMKEHGVKILDCQQTTPHMLSLGAEEISRAAFLAHLRRLCG